MTVSLIVMMIALLLIGLLFLVAIPFGLLAVMLSPHVQQSLGRMVRALAPIAVVGIVLTGIFGLASFPVAQQAPEEARVAATREELKALGQYHHAMIAQRENSVVSSEASPVGSQVTRESDGAAASQVDDAAAQPEQTAAETSVDGLSPVAITAYVGESSAGRAVDTLPAWVTEAPQSDPEADTERFTVQSARFSSVDEADADALTKLRPQLAAYLQRGHVPLDVAQLTLRDIQHSHLRLERVVEEFELPLKSSVEPVYRTTWLVSLRPLLRDTLGIEHRVANRSDRLWTLGVGVALTTLLFGVWAAYFQIDDATQGRYRGRLKLAAAATTLGSLTGLFIS